MAESTLLAAYDDYRKAMAHKLGWGIDTTVWTSDQQTKLLMFLKSGMRQFYFQRDWRFLHPTTTLSAWGNIVVDSTVTITASGSGPTTLTAIGGTPFYSNMVGRSITITGVGTYTITAYTSSTVVTIAENITASTKTFSMTSGDYRMPDIFGSIEGDITFQTATVRAVVTIVGEGRIRQLRQQRVLTGRPQYAAVRPASLDATAGQRSDLMLWPLPDALYTLQYRYSILPDALTSSNIYPLGGAAHSETLKASCLAIVEREMNDERGVELANYGEKLAASIDYDNRMNAPDTVGINNDRSDQQHSFNRFETVQATYNGQFWGS